MITADCPVIETIMLIDDEEIDQMLYGRIIERSEHAKRVHSFLSAEAALAHLVELRDPKPDLVLLDINMPRMDGFEFLTAAEKVLDNGAAPVIVMLTTSLNPMDETRSSASPLVCDYKKKPLTDAMLKEFREELGRRAQNVA